MGKILEDRGKLSIDLVEIQGALKDDVVAIFHDVAVCDFGWSRGTLPNAHNLAHEPDVLVARGNEVLACHD
eukprot:8628224-Prorocentrum_lima.AAC.1